MKFTLFKRIPKTPREKKELRKHRMLLILSGILMAAGFPPMPFPLTLFIGLIPFFYVLEKRDRLIDLNRAAFLMAFVFSIGALYWVGAFTEMKDPYLMAGGITLFFINPVAFMVPATLYYYSKTYIGKRTSLWLIPFFWVFYEYLYTLTDWSFPWLNLGNGTANFHHFIQIADVIGVWGLSFLVVSINLLLYYGVKNYREKHIAIISALIVGSLFIVLHIYSSLSVPIKEIKRSYQFGIVQPNLDPYDKWAGNNIDEILNAYLADSRKLLEQKVDLLLWPETALPVYFMGGPYADIRDRLFAFIDSAGVPLFTGMPDIRYYDANDSTKPYDVKYNKRAGFYYATYNAIYMFHPNSRYIQKIGKNKLVPFGERVPFVDQLPILGDIMRWGVGIGGWNVGQDTNVIIMNRADGKEAMKLGGAICYESIYSDAVYKQVQRGAEAIVVVTNDSWYGNTSGPYQHRDFAKIRAVECRREIVRVANGGISCVIKSDGEITKQTNMYEKTVLAASVMAKSGLTFYVQYPYLITGFCSLVSLSALLMALILKYNQRLQNYIMKKRLDSTTVPNEN